MKIFKQVFSCCLSLAVAIVYMPVVASASTNTEKITGQVFEYDKKIPYTVTSTYYLGDSLSTPVMGNVSISGKLEQGDSSRKVKSYIVDEGENIRIQYDYTDIYAKADPTEWHIVDDGDEEVNGFDLDKDIDSGALILLTSLDREHWYLKDKYLDITSKMDAGNTSKSFWTNEVELTNGCYYKVIVAYKLEKKEKDSYFASTDVKKVAEAYEFYAAYKSAENKTVPANEQRYVLGSVEYVGNDDGFAKKQTMENDNPHYGWEIGNFYVSGYTSKTDDNTFVKNLGDRVCLWFNLKELDINHLHGTKNYIAEDTNGEDQYFQTGKTNMKHGALIVRYTNYRGEKSKPIIYTDFLAALQSPGADTKVQLFEEGDYEVALDYQINKDVLGPDTEHDYRIFFTFKIRNGNTMVYPMDVKTGSELLNTAVTENGFRLDMARSRYLKINVQLSRWTKSSSGAYVEDIRFNRPAKDGDEFTEEGIYTIKVSNPTTDPYERNITEKKIYVGTDRIMIASVNEANKGMTINDIAAKTYDGAEITEDGIIVMPEKKDESSEETPEAVSAVEANTSQVSEPDTSVVSSQPEQADGSSLPIVPIAAAGGGVVVLIGVIAAIKKSGGKKNEKES